MTLPANLPADFCQAARDFAETLRKSFASGMPAQPEDQLKGPVQALLKAARTGVLTKTEAQVRELGGRPDIGVEISGALCGFVELKAPGHGASTGKLKGRDKEQWAKFSALPNILYTDALEWALYRTGAQTAQDKKPILVRLDGLLEKGAAALDDPALAALHSLLVDFLSWQPIVPHEPRKLAETLAPLCRLLRADVFAAVEREGSALAHLCAEIRQYLFPHTDHQEFADIYAQTLTYALLLARIEGEADLTAESAVKRLDSGHGLLAQTLKILTQPEARLELETAVAVLERVIGAVDPKKLSKRGDPWLYFYEHFLAAYDPKLRASYGVYYTPQEVIACQTALVSQLLAEQFDKPLTFADEGVVLLDSSAGTGAYPLAAIESALRLVEQREGAGSVPGHATRCAQNVYAFEILVGPYAVAHLRLTKLLRDAGAALPADGLHVLLTDTLESPHADPPQPPLIGKRLTDEQRRASRVKAEVPVFVCMGNPPYFREESDADGAEKTRGKWVRFGDEKKPGERPILTDFIRTYRVAEAKEIIDAELAPPVHVKNLYNLYVYFWRWTLWKMFENPQPGATPKRGIVSFITAASYLRGPGFAGMRRRMREAFDELWIIDLEGDNLGARKTENVFAIQTPVCIATGIRHAAEKRNALAKVRYARVTGTREEKLARLITIKEFAGVDWQDCLEGATDPLLPKQAGNYFAWPLVTDLWPWQCCGVKFERAWPVGETRELLEARWRTLLAAPADEKPKLFREDDDRKVNRQYTALRPPRERLPEIAKLPPNTPPLEITRYAFRSFDREYALADNRIGGRMNPALWRAHGDQQVYLTSLLTSVLGIGPAAVASANITDLDHFRGSFGGKHVIPLWRHAADTQPNLPAGLLSVFGASVTAEDFFAYTYAVLHAPGYVETFSEELTLPGPRLPVTRDAALFARAVALGRRLLWLHTYGERFLPPGAKRGQIPGGGAKCLQAIPSAPEGYPEEFSWAETGSGDIPVAGMAAGGDRNVAAPRGLLRVGAGEFAPVSRAVWEFSVSGYEVVKGWLGFRMKERSGRKSSPLDAIRPAAWTAALTTELLELLWVLEATVAAQPALNALLAEILAAPLFAAADFPVPTPAERAAPNDAEERLQAVFDL